MEATRNPPPALALRALARLLDYPAEPLFGHLDELGAALDAAPVKPARRSGVRPLLERLASCDPLDAQELYIDTFDRGRRSSLNLFEHVHGDSRDRGQAMVDLLEMYRAAGVELDTDQLPDYLPAFLEYLSLLPAREAREHLAEVTHLVRAVGGVLASRRSDYAGAFDLLLALAGEAPLGADQDSEDDTSYAAVDAAWLDAPVDFMGAAAPCAGASRPATEQPVQFQRRVA
jgi:nitrate reductase molybdenum cofactor assembly chaperone NarJ/NarW